MNNATRKRSKFLSPPWLMFGSAMLCVVLVPLVHAAVNQSGERSERLKQLASMTKSERLRVQHQFEKFGQLTPAQQNELRQLHNRLNGDEIALKSTLADYEQFLSSLNPVERAEIERQTTNRERVRAVRQVQQDREYRQQQLDQGLANFDERRTSFEQEMGRRGWGEVLDDDEMEAISNVLLSNLPTDVVQRLQIDQQHGAARYALTLAAVLQTWGKRATGVERLTIPQDVLQEVMAVIENEKIQASFREIPTPERRVFALFMRSERSLMTAYMKDVPATAELQEFLETREPEVREELMQKEPAWMYLELIKMYRETNPTPLSQALTEFKSEFDEVKKFWFRKMREDEEERGPGGRGPGGRGPGGRGPGGREFERPRPDGEKPSPGERPLRDRINDFRERREGKRPESGS